MSPRIPSALPFIRTREKLYRAPPVAATRVGNFPSLQPVLRVISWSSAFRTLREMPRFNDHCGALPPEIDLLIGPQRHSARLLAALAQ
jgi:hypothetical protein